MKKYLDKNGLTFFAQKFYAKIKPMLGAPLVAETAAEMTDESRVYVYVGSEEGYTSGDWYYYNGSAWVSGGIYNAAAVQTDTTLNISGMAADAAATGEKIGDVKSVIEKVLENTEEIDFSQYEEINFNISPSTDTWIRNDNNYRSYIVPVPINSYAVKITANENVGTSYALLADDSHTHSTAPDYASGQSRSNIEAGGTVTVILPADCTYVWISKTVDGGTTIKLPSSASFDTLNIIPTIDDTLSIQGDAADAKKTGDEISLLKDAISNDENLDFDYAELKNYIIVLRSGNTVWDGSQDGSKSGYFIPVPNGAKKLTVKANDNNASFIAFLKSDNSRYMQPADLCDGTQLISLTAGSTETYDVPPDCTVIHFRKTNTAVSSSEYTPAVTSFYCIIDAYAAINQIQAELDEVVAPSIPSQIFNVDLSVDGYDVFLAYDPESVTDNGYSPTAGWENRAIINKYIVCDDVKYRANISLGTAGTGVCVLGTQSLAGSPSHHATLVKFDFGNALVSFLTGSDAAGGGNIDGKTIPAYTYDSFALENLSGTEYRIEIGRKKRAPYAKVYNLTTSQLCGEKTLSIYETDAGYGGKAGAMYDIPNFGVLDGTITFKRVSASVPNGVFAAFIGDSITEGSKVSWADTWANKSILYLGSGVNCGRGSGKINHALRCAEDILPAVSPKYVVVTIGTNGTPTSEEFQRLIALIRHVNAIPIINRIPMNNKTGSGSTAEVNAIVETLGCDSVMFDVATALNNDTAQGQDASLFNSDHLHPNAAGGIAMYNQFIADLGWIKSDD